MNFAKSFKRAVTTMVAVGSCWVGTSLALPIVWTDSVGSLDRLITEYNPYSYTLTITHGAQGYRPGVDTITGATLSIWLYDDAFFGDIPLIGDGEETVGFRLDNGVWQAAEVDTYFYLLDNFDFTVTSLVTDGLLNVTVKSLQGDFGFKGSTLVAYGTPGVEATAVPEPASLALFGVGLLGMGLATRLRRRKIAAR